MSNRTSDDWAARYSMSWDDLDFRSKAASRSHDKETEEESVAVVEDSTPPRTRDDDDDVMFPTVNLIASFDLRAV